MRFSNIKTTNSFYRYRIAPLELDRVATTVSAGAVEDITFTLSDDAPSSWFVQASTGVIYGQFDAPGDYEFQVLAVDKAGQSDVLEALSFAVVEQQDFKIGVTGTRSKVCWVGFLLPVQSKPRCLQFSALRRRERL